MTRTIRPVPNDPPPPYQERASNAENPRSIEENISATRVPAPAEFRRPLERMPPRPTFFPVTRGFEVGITQSLARAQIASSGIENGSPLIRTSWDGALEVYTNAHLLGLIELRPRTDFTGLQTVLDFPRNAHPPSPLLTRNNQAQSASSGSSSGPFSRAAVGGPATALSVGGLSNPINIEDLPGNISMRRNIFQNGPPSPRRLQAAAARAIARSPHPVDAPMFRRHRVSPIGLMAPIRHPAAQPLDHPQASNAAANNSPRSVISISDDSDSESPAITEGLNSGVFTQVLRVNGSPSPVAGSSTMRDSARPLVRDLTRSRKRRASRSPLPVAEPSTFTARQKQKRPASGEESGGSGESEGNASFYSAESYPNYQIDFQSF